MPLCHGCQKPAVGDTINAMGKLWHARCFICAGCRKAIRADRFVVFMDKPWHINCLLCPGCRKPVRDRYIEKDEQPWHVSCFHRQFTPACAVCGEPLQGGYLQDFWGNRYCEKHRNYDRCTSCGRIVCGALTGGGMRFPDGLVICNLCCDTGVVTEARAETLALEMRGVLKRIGLDLGNAPIPVHLAGRDELHRFSRHKHHDEHPLLGLARWKTTKAGGRIVDRSFEDIIIQQNLPELHFRTVAIHELCHAWFFYNQYEGLPLAVEEGMCVLMEYLWLRSCKTRQAAYFMRQISSSRDPIYGDGFRQARKGLKRLPMKVLLQYLKENRRFPGAIAAFFYH